MGSDLSTQSLASISLQFPSPLERDSIDSKDHPSGGSHIHATLSLSIALFLRKAVHGMAWMAWLSPELPRCQTQLPPKMILKDPNTIFLPPPLPQWLRVA